MILCVCPNPSIDTLMSVDDLSPGQVHRVRSEERFPGGKGTHVALAAAELGAEVTLLAFWAGPSGQWIREQCEKLGVKCVGPEIAGWARSCITFQSKGAYNETELLGVGPELQGDDVGALTDCLDELAPSAAVIAMSGSWPSNTPFDTYALLMHRLKPHQKPVMLDCTGAALETALHWRPEVVHVNRQEAQDVTEQADPRVAARLLARSCNIAVVTAGAVGAYFVQGDRLLHASCHIETTHSCVGSGDCLVAGLAVARERNVTIEEAAKLAAACGAANCLRPELGMLHRSDVERLVNQVNVQEMR